MKPHSRKQNFARPKGGNAIAGASKSADRKPRVCFSLLFAEQLLNNAGGYFGGAEVRGVTFLKGIAARNEFDLHVVVRGAARPPVKRPDGLTLHFRPDGLFDEGRQDSTAHSVWAEVDADVYLVFGANEAGSEVARFCKAHGSALVMSIASDGAFDPFVYENSAETDPYGIPGHYIWYGMRHAHAIVVQTERQASLLRALVSRDATLIRNPAPIGTRSAPRKAPSYGGRLLWIGRLDPNKRAEEAFAMVSALPHRQFMVVCNNIRSLGAGQIEEMQQKLPNLMLADQVDLRDIDALFRFSDLLINTSVIEGFPNTFLQAGMHGVPIVSMAVDPDGMLSEHGCGRVADGTRQGLALEIEALLTNTDAYARASEASARWVHERHDADGRMAELSAVLHRAAKYRARRTAAHVA